MNLSRNEKITLMLFLIVILVVIYLYTNKQEKLDNTNDNQIISPVSYTHLTLPTILRV